MSPVTVVIRVNVPLFRLKIREMETGDPGSAVPRAVWDVNEHAGARLENGGLASLALVRAGQGSAIVRRRIKRGQKKEA